MKWNIFTNKIIIKHIYTSKLLKCIYSKHKIKRWSFNKKVIFNHIEK